MSDPPKGDPLVNEIWRHYLTTGDFPDYVYPLGLKAQDLRRIAMRLPADPRCTNCARPFAGVGGWFVRLTAGVRPSMLNPRLCNACEEFLRKHVGGAEVELTLLFVDVRGSTTLAEKSTPAEFTHLINRFYRASTDALVHANALVEKIIGDEVTGLFVPGLAGNDHARVAIETARAILRATGHADPAGPWAPAGAGVHTGVAYVGAVGTEGGLTDIAALGDDVNVAARLAAQAGPGEVIVSAAACAAAGDEHCAGESRRLQLKGRGEPVDVRVLRA